MNEKTYLMEDDETGEQFFVEAKNEEDAIYRIAEWFDNFHLVDEVDPVWAEMMGLDTY